MHDRKGSEVRNGEGGFRELSLMFCSLKTNLFHWSQSKWGCVGKSLWTFTSITGVKWQPCCLCRQRLIRIEPSTSWINLKFLLSYYTFLQDGQRQNLFTVEVEDFSNSWMFLDFGILNHPWFWASLDIVCDFC